jgi:electron transfer flavoprotein beta subunit
LVLLGKQSVDDDCNQTGQILAGLLNWPQATFASKVDINGSEIEVTREVDTGLETIKFKSPAVITCDLRLNTPKIASLPQMMKAKKANIEEVELSSLGLQPSKVEIVETYEPAKKKGGVKVKDVDELIEKLQKEAKVL